MKLANKRLEKVKKKVTLSAIHPRYENHYLIRHVEHIEKLLNAVRWKRSEKRDEILKHLSNLKDFLCAELYAGEQSTSVRSDANEKVRLFNSLKKVLTDLIDYDAA